MKPFIGNKVIKVTFIRTLPGAEFQVAHELEKACHQLGVKNYSVLKALGGFDIILLYPSKFDFHLTEFGMIKDILEFNTFLSFSYRWLDGLKRIPDVIRAVNRATFCGFSLVKMNIPLPSSIKELEANFFRLLEKWIGDSNHFHILGTLGWNEFILIFTGENLNEIIKSFFRLNYGDLIKKSGSHPLAKTLTYVAINYDRLLGSEWGKFIRGTSDLGKLEQIKELLLRFKRSEGLRDQIGPEIEPAVRISFQPGHSTEIRGHWQKRKFVCLDTLGEDDMLVMSKEGQPLLWGDLLYELLAFRLEFHKQIYRTSTVLNYKSEAN